MRATKAMLQAYPILEFFEFDHLSERLQAVSRPWCNLALRTARELPQSAETATALRKLLEGKDCAVRAALKTTPPTNS